MLWQGLGIAESLCRGEPRCWYVWYVLTPQLGAVAITDRDSQGDCFLKFW